MIGAATGATPLIAPIIASVFANSLPVNISVATEREITIPPAPTIPCSKRSIANISIVGAKMQPIVEMIKRYMAANNGERRPYLSLSGPKKICPAVSPIILAVKPNCTNEGVVLKYSPIEGRLGMEVSVFSSESQPYEIYVSYGRMYGIIYSNAEDAYAKLEEIKKVLEKEYKENKEPTAEFVEAFVEKYQLELPQDIFFDASVIFDLF